MGRGIGFRQFRILWGMSQQPQIAYTFFNIRPFFPMNTCDSDIMQSLSTLIHRDLIHHSRSQGVLYYTITPDGEREVERSPHRARFMAEHYGDARQLDWVKTK